MALGNQVEKPRFFINLLNYQYEIGNIAVAARYWGDPLEKNPHLLNLNPMRGYDMSDSGATGDNAKSFFKVGFKYSITIPSGSTMFIALLGHDIGAGNTVTADLNIWQGSGWWQGSEGDGDLGSAAQTCEPLVNGGDGGHQWHPSYSGWSLLKFNPVTTTEISSFVISFRNTTPDSTSIISKFGGLAIGFMYEPEFHADLAVTQRRIMDGVKQKQTKGGNTYSIINHLKPPNWWNCNPFELYDHYPFQYPTSFGTRIGRRSWDVRFSQLQDRFYTDGVPNGVFPANEMIEGYDADIVNGGYTDGEDVTVPPNSGVGDFNYNLATDNSLYSTVYHHSLGGTLPFLFSPSQDNSPGNFSICRFDKPGFQVQQKSYKKFNVKMRINETW